MLEKNEKKRHNLRDVARRARVSVATVSRVLNTPNLVSERTRERVEQAISDLHFVPSAAARAINSGRSHMVAALLPTLDNSIYARVVNGLENKLAQFGLSLIVAQTGEDPKTEFERARALVDIGAEGLVITGITHEREFEQMLQHMQMPTVAVSFYDPDYLFPTIGYDNREAVTIAARHLFDLGHRSLSIVHGPIENNDRYRERRSALQSLDLPLKLNFFEESISIEGGCRAAEKILKNSANATGVLCFSDVLAMGVMNELHRQERRIPEDMSVMGIEDLPSSQFTTPELTSVRLQVQQMGEQAADSLAGWLENDIRPDAICLPSKLMQRRSTAPPSC